MSRDRAPAALPSAGEVREFWIWFQRNAEAIEKALASSDTVAIRRLIEPAIANLSGSLGWEFGPAGTGSFLAISPRGDSSAVPTVFRIVADAPHVEGWTFMAGKPTRAFHDEIVFQNIDGQSLHLRIASWRYVLTSFNSGEFFDISVHGPNLPVVDAMAEMQILATIVQGAVGELTALDRFDRYRFERRPAPEWLEASTPLERLADHFALVASVRPPSD